MSQAWKIVLGFPVIVILFIAGTLVSTQLKARESGEILSPTQARLGAVDSDTKDLLALMDTNRNGKISKQEFMRFMEAEFDRLDKDKSGELDVRELTQSRLELKPGSFAVVGK